MKLNENFIKHKIDGETLLVPTAGAPFHGLVQGNESVDAILECLEKDTTEEEVIDYMCRSFVGDRETISADVADVIARLRKIGAIDD